MRKIPTVFVRDPYHLSRVIDAWHPDCLWVADGEGVPTRKYDGTCVMYDGSRWWARREVKTGRRAPHGFQEVDRDPNTGRRVGWEPIEKSPFYRYWLDAAGVRGFDTGTYELCGPSINGNPERFEQHVLVRHADAELLVDTLRTFAEIRRHCIILQHEQGVEGIVFHHPDGRMAKIKGRDFR
jgi:hypothetical protein